MNEAHMIADTLLALGCVTVAWFFCVGCSKWSARRTSREEALWLLVWGNLMRLGVLWSVVGALYFFFRMLGDALS